MITREENELLTRTGPGSPCGELMRRYWQPVALAEELPPSGAPLPLKVMGEELVLYRLSAQAGDDQGLPALLDLHCPHRGADLSYGRLEDGGIRCIYHGWLFDKNGRCLDQPGEPDGGRQKELMRLKAYPCKEQAGIIFGYLGPGEPPLLPNYEILTVPAEQRFVCKVFSDCNYLQGNEGNIDPIHLSFLHRIMDEGLATGSRPSQYQKVRGSEAPPSQWLGANVAPAIDIDLTDFGLRISTRRPVGDKAYLRVSNFVMPNLCAVPGETQGAGYLVNWHVPVDDEHHWKYMIVFSREAPLDREKFSQRYRAEIGPDYRPIRNRSNRYLQDREEMKIRTFTGLGSFFPAHDLYATETKGPIQDRTQEHLTSSDKAIVAARKLLLKAMKEVQEGREAPHVQRSPDSNRFPRMIVLSEIIPSGTDWKDYTKEAEVRALI